MLHEAVQTYDVEMTCKCSIDSASVTNDEVGPEVQALHTAMCLELT